MEVALFVGAVLFIAGIAAGVIGVVSLSSHREDRDFRKAQRGLIRFQDLPMARPPRGPMARAARFVVNTGVRADVAGGAGPARGSREKTLV